MAQMPVDEAGNIFNPMRPQLMRSAYPMLDSIADAEDAVQEAFVRWTLHSDNGLVQGIYVARDPDKLEHLAETALF